MNSNTLSALQNLNLIHNTTEGNFNRSMTLLLLTNKESAYRVIETSKFRNETREFGKGLYFVETLEESETFDIKDRAVVLCQVFVGVSLVLTRPDPNITEKFLRSKDCDSVKGFLSCTQKYYVVYNYKNVERVIALKAETSVVRPHDIHSKCTNHLCKSHGTAHWEDCQLLCKDKNCRHFNGYHTPPCTLKCSKPNCELFESFHKGDCRIRCTWENCLMFGKFHSEKCVHLEHEKSIPEDEGLVYNKIRFAQIVKKVDSKKKKNKVEKESWREASEEKKNFRPILMKNSEYRKEFPRLGDEDKAVPQDKPVEKIFYPRVRREERYEQPNYCEKIESFENLRRSENKYRVMTENKNKVLGESEENRVFSSSEKESLIENRAANVYSIRAQQEYPKLQEDPPRETFFFFAGFSVAAIIAIGITLLILKSS